MTNDDLGAITEAEEVTIETRSADRVFRTVIWVSESDGTPYVRSFLGDSGRWYQRAVANPEVALLVGKTRVPFRAVPAADAESVERASRGFLEKYRKGKNLDAMVRPEVLHTTLRLEPAR